MNKNTIIGFIAIGAIMFGFSWYQSSQVEDQIQQEAQAKTEQQIATAQEALIAAKQAEIVDSLPQTQTITVQEEPVMVAADLPYKDAQLNAAYGDASLNPGLLPQFDTLSNNVVEMVFTTKGAQPYSVRLTKYNAYNPVDPDKPKELYFVRPGSSD